MEYPLVMTNRLLLKMAIEIVDFSKKHGAQIPIDNSTYLNRTDGGTSEHNHGQPVVVQKNLENDGDGSGSGVINPLLVPCLCDFFTLW